MKDENEKSGKRVMLLRIEQLFRLLGYELTRELSRLSCSMLYVPVVVWFFLLFGQFCGRNVVGKQSCPGLSESR